MSEMRYVEEKERLNNYIDNLEKLKEFVDGAKEGGLLNRGKGTIDNFDEFKSIVDDLVNIVSR